LKKHETLNINCFFIEDIFVFNIKNEPYVVFKKPEKPIKNVKKARALALNCHKRPRVKKLKGNKKINFVNSKLF